MNSVELLNALGHYLHRATIKEKNKKRRKGKERVRRSGQVHTSLFSEDARGRERARVEVFPYSKGAESMAEWGFFWLARDWRRKFGSFHQKWMMFGAKSRSG